MTIHTTCMTRRDQHYDTPRWKTAGNPPDYVSRDQLYRQQRRDGRAVIGCHGRPANDGRKKSAAAGKKSRGRKQEPALVGPDAAPRLRGGERAALLIVQYGVLSSCSSSAVDSLLLFFLSTSSYSLPLHSLGCLLPSGLLFSYILLVFIPLNLLPLHNGFPAEWRFQRHCQHLHSEGRFGSDVEGWRDHGCCQRGTGMPLHRIPKLNLCQSLLTSNLPTGSHC